MPAEPFQNWERRKRDNEDGHHVFERQRDYHSSGSHFLPVAQMCYIVDTPGHMDFLAEVYRSLGCFRWGHLCDLR